MGLLEVRSRWREAPRTLRAVAALALAALIVAGLAGPRPAVRFGAPEGRARAQLESFSSAIELYALEADALPPSLADLTRPDRSGAPYLARVPLDPWGRSYAYLVVDPGSGEYELRSAGEDGRRRTADDLVLRRKARR